ncbi:hypothetical protein KAX06_06395 [candidate division WOR-3 bacterium]|nr:hypothetical protein [candidate division WOR-3 bacterium]MCK4334396.1 hypothetical protein [candidate division WOR-3 bacterium]
MNFWEKLGKIDRRIIYMVLAVAVIVPLILTVKLPSKVRAMPRTKSVFDHIESIDPNGQRKAILLSVDFDPQTEPELKPQLEAIIRHAFARNIPLLVMALPIQGTDIGLEVLTRLAEEHNKEYGIDYVLLGWKPSPVAVVLGMGNFIDQVFPTDYFGTPLSELPVMEGIRNYDNIGLAMDFTGSSLYGYWVYYAHTPYDVPVATGVTSVSVADIYPFLGSKQFVGMLAGMKAGAEYERLAKDRYYPDMKIDLLEPNSFKVTVEKQSFDADSNDIASLARRFDLNLDELYNTLDSQGKFEKTLVLLEFPDTTTYSRDLIVRLKEKQAYTITLEGQKLTVNKDKMLAIANFYGVSKLKVNKLLKKEDNPQDPKVTDVERSIFLRGTQALPALSASLLVIILFVILGNISHFATRRKK